MAICIKYRKSPISMQLANSQDERSIMNFKTILQDELELEERILKQLRAQLSNQKDLRLYAMKRKNGKLSYAEYDGVKRSYLREKDAEKINDLKYHMLLKSRVNALENNITILQKTRDKYEDYSIDAASLSLKPPYRLSASTLYGLANDGSEPAQSENAYHREGLIFKLSNGMAVRSKNELTIGEQLISHGLDFRYEKLLRLYDLNGRLKNFYPDFTINAFGRELYWEHLGLMNNDEYKRNAEWKIDVYRENGIIANDNLILTEGDIDSRLASKLVRFILM